jgi:amino acid transporter
MTQAASGQSAEVAASKLAGSVFARKSSGLVRNISTFDTFYYNLVQLGPQFAFFNLAFAFLYPGANMEIAGLIALIIALAEGVTYGLYASIYPRSGGEYIPLSRSLNPFVGFVMGFTQTTWQAFQTAPVAVTAITMGLAPMFVALGLQTHNQNIFNFGVALDSPWGWFIFSGIVVLISVYILHRGMNVYFKVQRYGYGIALLGFVILILVCYLGSTGTFSFQASYAKYFGSGAYDQLIANAQAEGFNMKSPFSWRTTMFFTIWPAFSFIFAILSTAFSGEIKNVKRGQLIGMTASQIVGGILVLGIGLFGRLALTNEGMLAIGVVSSAGKFPLPYPWISMLASIMADNVILTIIINLSVAALSVFTCASTIVYASRGYLAFGIDGMGPSWFAKVHEKYHTPTNTLIMNAVIAVVFLTLYSFTDLLHMIVAMMGGGIVIVTTTLAASLMPFMKKKVYEASPAKMEIFGIPVMTITGVIGSLGCLYFVYRTAVDNDYGANNPFQIAVTLGVFVVGAIWYFIARAIRRRQGVDMDARFKEIPVE